MIEQLIGEFLNLFLRFEYDEQIKDLPLIPKILIHVITLVVVLLTGITISKILFYLVPNEAHAVVYIPIAVWFSVYLKAKCGYSEPEANKIHI